MASKRELGRKFKDQLHQFSTTEWTKTYITRNTSNKALMNMDTGLRRIRRKYQTYWADLPDLLLEKIFSYLTIRERFYASLVCRNWNRAFYLPGVWARFTLEDSTLTRARFNYYQGWQYVLDHVRTQLCLTQVGSLFKCLIFAPMLNFFNLYEFMNMLSWYVEQGDSPILNSYGIGAKIQSLKFTFPCNMDNPVRDEDEITKLFGTGGRLLGALKRLMMNLPELKRLELIDLMLDVKEAQHLLDGVCDICCTSMQTLILINTTKLQYPLLHLGVFLNLRVLVISPQNLGDDVIELLGYTKLQHLHIHQNVYTPDYVMNLTSPKVWKNCTKNNKYLQVHLEMEHLKEKRLLLWPSAPVNSILYTSPQTGVQLAEVMNIIEHYKNNLRMYGHRSLPRGFKSKKFHDRIDESILLLCRGCPKLQILIITERISTATLLLIATTCKNLKHLYVRRNAVIKKFDWTMNPNWSDELIEWLKHTAYDYSLVELEISQIFGYKWRMLSDRNFKELHVDMDETE